MPTTFVQSDNVFTRSLSNRLEEIADLAGALEEWASDVHVPRAAISAVNLMLDELITNVVLYGYAATQRGEITVHVGHAPGRLDVELRDHAPPFNPLKAAEPDLLAEIEDRAIGGLGVHFVRQLADEVTYERVNEGGRDANIVRIVKQYLPPLDQAH